MTARRLASVVRSALAGAALAGAALALVPARSASADTLLHGGDEVNYWIKLPSDNTWAWGRPGDFAKFGAIEVGERRVDKLPNGDPPKLPDGRVLTGCGARMILTRQDVPKDLTDEYESILGELQILESKAKSDFGDQGVDVPEELDKQIKGVRKRLDGHLESLLKLEKVQDLILSRYGKNAPKVDLDTGYEVSGVPAGEIKASGTAPNLAGEDAPCEGHMLVWVFRKQVWRVCTWVWPAPRIGPILRAEQDEIEFGIVHPKTAAIPKKPVEVIAAGTGNGDPSKEGDSEEEKRIVALDRESEIFKPKGWISKSNQQIDRSKPFERELCFQVVRHDRQGSEAIISVSAFRMQGGTSPFDPDKHMESVWRDFQVNHPKGPIQTFPFPRIADKTKFLALPDFTKPKDVERTLDKDGKVEMVKRSRLEDMGVVEEAKAQIVFGKERLRMTWRIALRGVMDRIGEETSLQYIFASSNWAYVVYVTFRKDGQKAWAAEAAKILSSFKLIEAPK